MSVTLSFKNDSRRETLIAHSFWERLMIRAIIVNLIAECLYWHAILAFLVGLMPTSAFSFHF